jgi:hypothetical protein
MKEIQRSRFIRVGILVTVALIVLISGFTIAQMQVLKKKPQPPEPDPEEYVWSAALLYSPESHIQGTGAPYNIEPVSQLGWLFDDADANIDVTARLIDGGLSGYRSGFKVEFIYPVLDEQKITFPGYIEIFDEYFVTEFPNIDSDLNPNFEYKPCRYPGCDDICSSTPTCMVNFLQTWPHPCVGYEKAHIYIHSLWTPDQNEANFEGWDLYDKICFMVEIHAQEIDDGDFKTPDLTEFNHIALDSTDQIEYGYCQRMDPDTWRFVLGRNLSGESFVLDSARNVNIEEWYSDIVTERVNKNRTKEVVRTFWPTFGKCNMQFEILFFRRKN